VDCIYIDTQNMCWIVQNLTISSLFHYLLTRYRHIFMKTRPHFFSYSAHERSSGGENITSANLWGR